MERHPRVVLACDWFVRYTAGLAGGLEALGAAVALVTRSHDEEFGSTPGAMGAYLRHALGDSVPRVQVDGRVRDPRGIAAAARAWRRVGRFAPDVVHLQDSALNDPRLTAVARARPRRYALTVHDLELHPGDPRMRRSQTLMWRALIRGAGLIFVHAPVLRDRLVRELRPRGAVVVVPHGASEPAVAPLPDLPSLLVFGRMAHYKGVDTLLDAMPLIWAQLPGTRLTIAGKGPVGPHATLADPRVSLRNEYIPDGDVPHLFHGATCAVLPYREASQSGVAALAKRHGRPLVATSVGGLPDLAADGSTRLVPPEDPGALAEALLEVLRARDLAERMSRAAAEAAGRDISWRRVAELSLEAYERHL
jgi:glycosyltransferase involved in cell wall biosynthesis